MALTRAEIAERLIIKVGLPKATAQEFVDKFFEEIARKLEKGEMVKLTGFGNFELKLKSARPGRNPKTGQEVTISERRVTTFRAGQKLRNRIDFKKEEIFLVQVSYISLIFDIMNLKRQFVYKNNLGY